MSTYESTDKTIPLAPAPESPPVITRRDVLDDGSAFVLENVLTAEECAHYVKEAEKLGFQDCGYSRRIRVTDRLVVSSWELAEQLFERASSFLCPEYVLPRGGRYPRGIPSDVEPGMWKAVGLNECLRVCRYDHGGFFLPHHDYGFQRTNTEQSLLTFMFYLNDDYEGGPTNFYLETQEHYSRPDPAKVICSVRASPGSVLVFPSRITHDGGVLESGRKYLMRTEVMYELQVNAQDDDE